MHTSRELAEDPLAMVNSTKITALIGDWITQLVKAQEEFNDSQVVSYFHAQSVPGITIKDYLNRIDTYSNYSKGVIVAAMVYMARVLRAHPEIPVIGRTIHRLIITAVLVAAKFTDDVHLNNAAFAQIGGVSVSELARLEVHFLSLIDFHLFISEEEYCAASQGYLRYSCPALRGIKLDPLATPPRGRHESREFDADSPYTPGSADRARYRRHAETTTAAC
eukprot:TRINITY_DN7130_c0_g1_i1.p1 TRINITY_DN7130_c0_g1~~TRINITY_DN7130_c0_g1_i1.p1  ORF type:complete len:221 (-),score=52.65 TRINITY_DN7130_c0_g1_i1:563-1225(-)